MRRALEGLDGVEGAEVNLDSGDAIVRAGRDVSGEELARAVRGKVILSWARAALARAGRRDR